MSPSWTQEQYLKAWDFATIAHEGQTYGGPKPGMQLDYINHVSSVTMELIWALSSSSQEYNDSLAVQCALLHDILEDTKITYVEIENEFGIKVAQGVLALSKNAEIKTKKEQLVDSLNRIKLQPKEIWMVKLADRITNLSPPPYYWSTEKVASYKDESKLIYDFLYESNSILAKRLKSKIKKYNL